MISDQKKTASKLNKLLRYQAILETYLAHKTDDIPLTVVWRKYIYPKYFISKNTLYNVINTPINKEIKEIRQQVGESF